MSDSMQVTVGGEPVSLRKPKSYSVAYDVFQAGVSNYPRAVCAALGLCWRGKGKPKATYELTYSPLVYGGQVLDELIARGLKPAEIIASGVVAYKLLTGELFSDAEVEEAEGN